MTLLITALLVLLPLTVSAESRGGVTVGPSGTPSVGGLHVFGMQGMESQMPESRLPNIRGIRGRGLWPMTTYIPTPHITIVNVQGDRQEEPPPPPPKPPAPAKFWTARCGTFVELQVSPTMNLMEEEQKGCPD